MPTNIHNKHKHKNLKIALWNANSVGNKIGELTHFLNTHKIDIIAISETKLTNEHTLAIRNYTTYRTDRTRSGGGSSTHQKRTYRSSYGTEW